MAPAPQQTIPEVDGPWQVTVQESVPDRWQELLDSDPGADFFHSAAWADAVARRLPGVRPLWLSVRRDGVLAAGLAAVAVPGRIPRLISHFEGTSGGVLVRSDLPPATADRLFDLLTATLAARSHRWLGSCGISLNTAHEARFGARLAATRGWVRQAVPAAVVPLAGGLDQVETHCLHKNKRNERNRSLRRGAEVAVTRDPEVLREYYPLYLAAAASWGVPPVPCELLTDLLTVEAPPASAFFTVVRAEGRLIGGHLNLQYGDRVVAWNGVTDPAFSRSHFPATLAVWGDLAEACRRGAGWLDLGASGGLSSLSVFKNSFGAEEQARGWYVNDRPAVAVLRRGRGLWRQLIRGGGPDRRWHDRRPEPRP